MDHKKIAESGIKISLRECLALDAVISGGRTLGQIAELTGTSKTQARGHVTQLLKKGLVEKHVDGRNITYQETQTGRALL